MTLSTSGTVSEQHKAARQDEHAVYWNRSTGVYAVCETGSELLEQDHTHVIQRTRDFDHAVEIAILHNQRQIQTIYQIIDFQQENRKEKEL
jgi:hypothetical protein